MVWRRSYDTPPPPLDFEDERHPRFEERYDDLDTTQLPVSERLYGELLSLPLHPGLSHNDVKNVCQAVIKFMKSS